MGDMTIRGDRAQGTTNTSSVASLDANSLETPKYSQPRVVGDTTVYLTDGDAKAFDAWGRDHVTLHKNRTTREAVAETVAQVLSFLKGS